MLSYKQKLRDKTSEKIKMGDFDLYADLPPLLPVEENEKPPAMSRKDISTLQKHPFLAGRPLSDTRTSSSEISAYSDTSTTQTNKKIMLESTPHKQTMNLDERLFPKITAADCMHVLPQNTIPMSKYRKKYVQKKKMKENAEQEGILTDEEIWKRRKIREEQEKLDSLKRHHRSRGHRLDWEATAEGYGHQAHQGKKCLEEEIYRPTYVVDANLEEESLFAAIGKNIPRRKIAVVSTLMQKIDKRKQEKQEREMNEKIMTALNSVDTRKKTDGNPFDDKPDKPEPTSEEATNAESQSATDKVNPTETSTTDPNPDPEGIEKVINRELDTLSSSASHNALQSDSQASPRTTSKTTAKSTKGNEPSLHRTKSEGDLYNRLTYKTSSRRNDEVIPPPENFVDTRTLISYSEMLMASAQHNEKAISMVNLSQTAEDALPLDYFYTPSLAESAMADFVSQQPVVLPPEINGSRSDISRRANHQNVKRAKSMGNLHAPSPDLDSLAGDHIYARVRKAKVKPVTSKHRRRSTARARSAMRKSAGSRLSQAGGRRNAPLTRSASSSDLVLLHRLASIVEKQNEIIHEWQMAEGKGSGRRRRVSRRRSLSVGGRPQNKRSDEDNFDIKKLKSSMKYPSDARLSYDSTTSLSSYGGKHELKTTFDDLTHQQLELQSEVKHARENGKDSVADVHQLSSLKAGSEVETSKATNAKVSGSDVKRSNPAHTNDYSRVRTPNGHIYNEREIIASGNRNSTDVGSTHVKRESLQSIDLPNSSTATEKSKLSKTKSDVIQREIVDDPAIRSKSRCEVANNTSPVIKIDVINSREVHLSRDTESRMSFVSAIADVSGFNSHTITSLRKSRQKSLIRVKGIRKKPEESDADLKQKVQSVVNAGTGTNNTKEEEDGWWVLWSKREKDIDGNDFGGFLNKVMAFFGINNDEPKDDAVVAEVIQKLPGESQDTCQAAADDTLSNEEKKNADSVSVASSNQHNTPNEDSVSRFKRSKATKLKKGGYAPKNFPKTKSKTRSSYDDVSDVGALPSVSANTRQGRGAKFKATSRKQRSVDSGFSTNPTDDENGADVSPKTYDRNKSRQRKSFFSKAG